MPTNIFVNLPVKDLNKSIAFFTELGYKFNPQFTNENATCMIISDKIYVMLLVEKFFMTFTKKEICNTTKNAEAILALTVESRQEVDEMISKALKAGATAPNPPQDHGWMYGHGYQDPDGHLWEVFFMDMNAIPGNKIG
jgi:uncharacterized protein